MDVTLNLTVGELFDQVAGLELLQGEQKLSAPVGAVTHDSRTVAQGTIFVAFSGEYFDGHQFFTEVAEKGAVALIGSRTLADLQSDGIRIPSTVPYGWVANTRVALAQLAAAFHRFPSRGMTVIGITGTDGKTTTANILESILAQATQEPDFPHGRVGVISTVSARMCGRESDTGFHVTTPDAPSVQRYLAEMRDAGCQFAIIESTSQGIAQNRVDAIDFDVAAVTNITHEHIDWHGSRAAYIDAKADLFRMLYREGPASNSADIDAGTDYVGSGYAGADTSRSRWAILNADDRGSPDYPGSYEALTAVLDDSRETSHAPVQYLSYKIGQDRTNDTAATEAPTRPTVWADAVAYQPDRTTFRLHWSGHIGSSIGAEGISIDSTLLGDFNVQNILCAASVALAVGIEPDAIRHGIGALEGVLGRMERIDCGQPFLALVDFAHSPASLERALLTLRRLLAPAAGPPSPRIIAIFGSAGLRDVEKRRLMGQVSGRLADFTVITAEDPRTEDLAEINRAIAVGVLTEAEAAQVTIVPDRAAAIQTAVDMALPGDIVAAFGKGHERSMCFGTTEHPWNEQESMILALKKAGYRKP